MVTWPNPPLINCVDKNSFVGGYPPAQGQTFLQFFIYLKYNQANTKLQSPTTKSIKLIVQDEQNWWPKSGIPAKTNRAMEKMILHGIDEYKFQKMNKNKETNFEESKREQFFSKVKQTF